ncbi:MAG: N-acetyl-gamma-glutamyl-phosphate reductase [Verrucomicrobiales bacterium]|nr:N-acetyl-gamma-glutamyl-phosphate reductase [Verrucomicrobiales bacterium]
MNSAGAKIKIAVVGASGYSGQELLRLLIMHPSVEIVAVTSRAEAGKSLETVFPRFRGAEAIRDVEFIEPDIDRIVESGAEAAFLALPHGVAYEFAGPLLEKGLRVIDLSADFRLNDLEVYEEFYGEHSSPELLSEAVYGLPEIRRDEIRTARLVASPGCYPTSILLPLIPLLKAGVLKSETIAISSLSGTSGAGKSSSPAFLFCEVNESLRAYNAPKHRHLSEIEQELSIAAGSPVCVSFVPHLMPINQGIATTIFADLADTGLTDEAIAANYEKAYGDSPFVRVLGPGNFPDTKNVARTNFVDIGWVIDGRTDRLILCSAEDNLGKGASSQAIQSFNLMFGLPETVGLMNY